MGTSKSRDFVPTQGLGFDELPEQKNSLATPAPHIQYFGSSVARSKVSGAALRSVAGGGARARADAVSSKGKSSNQLNPGPKNK